LRDHLSEYERHDPEKALLHQVVREELESFLNRAREAGAPVARFVEREIRAYLDCSILARSRIRVPGRARTRAVHLRP
jgi:hypothetical protein